MANGDYEIKNYLYQVGIAKASEIGLTEIPASEDFAIAYANEEYEAKYC